MPSVVIARVQAVRDIANAKERFSAVWYERHHKEQIFHRLVAYQATF